MRFLNILPVLLILLTGGLQAQAPCEIYDFEVDPGNCTSDTTHTLWLDFEVDNPLSDSFVVTAFGQQVVGIYALSDLPITIPNFPSNNTGGGFVRVCVKDNTNNCCAAKQFLAPICASSDPCLIADLHVEVGDCNPDGTFKVWLSFIATDANSDTYDVWINGVLFGNFPLNILPLQIPNFQPSNDPIQHIKVCVNDNPDCCADISFEAPDCDPGNIDCGISNLYAFPGECTSDSTYNLWLNFQVDANTVLDSFAVIGSNGDVVGIFGVGQLPLTISNFPWGGENTEAVTVCILNPTTPNFCCETVEFNVPDCIDTDCLIEGASIEVDGCSSDSTINLFLTGVDFSANANVDSFEVYASNGDFLGQFPVDSFPIKFGDYPYSGDDIDYIKICSGDPDTECCYILQFNAPDCDDECGIYLLNVQTGDCNPDGTYKVRVNFEYVGNTPVDSFEIYSQSGVFLGTFALSDLPVEIANFPWNGQSVDGIKVCFTDAAGNECCDSRFFLAPPCASFPCDITAINIETGDCNNNGTYQIWVGVDGNFAPDDMITIFAGNNDNLGTYPFSEFPVKIDEFPWSGGQVDMVKVCVEVAGTICCEFAEFDVPDCINTGDCQITDLIVDPGQCTGPGMYEAWINFNVQDPSDNIFDLFINGQLFGTYNINDLPLQIPNFPASGDDFDHVKVCINDNPDCCAELEFLAPNCNDPCEIVDFVLETGDCTGDSSYVVEFDFEVVNGANATHYGVWANGQLIGTFPISDLPNSIQDFPWNGGPNDVIKICLFDDLNNAPYCCKTYEFPVPPCLNAGNCDIYDVVVETGDCNPDGSYHVWVDFEVVNPGNDFFEVYANGDYLGLYSLDSLPLHIPDFPGDNNGPNDVIKICINDQPNCCVTVEFPAPNCGGDCEIVDLVVETGDCTGDSSYVVEFDFEVLNPANATHYGVWANGNLIGTWPLSDLPNSIQDFPWGGGQVDELKICLFDSPNNPPFCCKTVEIYAPPCLGGGNCDIVSIGVEIGDCNPDGSYELWLNFEVVNPGSDSFDVLGPNGQHLGQYAIDDLPIYIPNYPGDGGINDAVKVCISGMPNCCAVKEYPAPNCNDDCEIVDLVIEAGDCTGDSSYVLEFDFEVLNPGNATHYGVWANGDLIGTWPLNDLPNGIQDFPWGGGQVDVIKFCLFDGPNNAPFCCKTVEFPVPPCLGGSDCEIYDVEVQTGDCNPDGSYNLWLNFEVDNPGNDLFEVWANNQYLGAFPLDSLPLHIPNFPGDNNGPNDVIKICINDQPNCCAVIEFPAPDCDGCGIYDLSIDVGDCTSDSTYKVFIDFEVSTPNIVVEFGVWVNGDIIGLWPLADLPLSIDDFPWGGGDYDDIRICLFNPNQQPFCCVEEEIEAPDCFDDDCAIYDLQVLTTECLCGQFFAVITFEHENGGSDGFNILGNGNDYGNYPYNSIQPIILGPFDGDGMTEWEFVVQDALDPDCQDYYEVGAIDCMTPVHDPSVDGTIVVSPNPASDWVQVNAQIAGHHDLGQADVDIVGADGRLVRMVQVNNANNFTLDVSDLPAGMYQLVVKTGYGKLQATFAKQ